MSDLREPRRRRWLLGAGMLLVPAPALAQAPAGDPAFAALAAEMRRRAVANGDQAYGAVLVREGKVVGEGVSAVVTKADPTAHAEIEALRDAARRSGTGDLAGTHLYGTSRACPMCESAAARAGVARMFFGPDARDAGAPRDRGIR